MVYTYFVLTISDFIMKNPKTPAEKSTPKAKIDQAVVAVASEAKTKKPSSTVKPPKQPQADTPKPVSKSKIEAPIAAVVAEKTPKKPSSPPKSPSKTKNVTSKAVVSTTDITPSERVGLTAGSIWHFLSELGATPVGKLISELSEEEKIIQRSIGWLAQEGKITLDIVDRVEIVSLK